MSISGGRAIGNRQRRKRACWTSQGSGPLILWTTSPGHPAYQHQPQPTPNAANHNIDPDQAHGSSGPHRPPTRRDHMDHQNRRSLVQTISHIVINYKWSLFIVCPLIKCPILIGLKFHLLSKTCEINVWLPTQWTTTTTYLSGVPNKSLLFLLRVD
jgi:hypothetical protein